MRERVAQLQDQLKAAAAHLEDVRQIADTNLAKYKQAEREKDLALSVGDLRAKSSSVNWRK